MSFNVAIDGPAGAGKSTIAKAVAKKMGLIYVDTGAMYRANALYILRNNVGKNDREKMIELSREADVTLKFDGGEQAVFLNGENVNPFIRAEEVGNMASVSSAIPEVRKAIVDTQKRIALDNDVIMDGRDIGTVVLPQADLKIYLTASSYERAKRRYKELQEKGEACDLETIQREIEERDYRDMHRETAPLKQAFDAVLVDSSDMTLDEVIDHIYKLCLEKKGN
ncbi:MAG: (d)CMP kinase [Lachnospiraceae bacterium]|nr:(d)CMP kinase [Lachnospiraceae bacterium]